MGRMVRTVGVPTTRIAFNSHYQRFFQGIRFLIIFPWAEDLGVRNRWDNPEESYHMFFCFLLICNLFILRKVTKTLTISGFTECKRIWGKTLLTRENNVRN